jgi:D-lactate dehydrogenase (cytochrome)
MTRRPIPPDVLARTIQALRSLFGERLAESLAAREQHGNTLSEVANQPPDAVVFVRSTEDVVRVVTLCAENDVPVIAFGTGTSFEGHVNAPHGGISLDT